MSLSCCGVTSVDDYGTLNIPPSCCDNTGCDKARAHELGYWQSAILVHSVTYCVVQLILFTIFYNFIKLFFRFDYSNCHITTSASNEGSQMISPVSRPAIDNLLSYSVPWYIGRILILGSRVTSQCCSAHAHIWRCCLLRSPSFLTSPYMERARGHVTAAQSRDLASPIYGHVGALTGCNWPRDLSRDLISLGPYTGVCKGCNVCPITHA